MASPAKSTIQCKRLPRESLNAYAKEEKRKKNRINEHFLSETLSFSRATGVAAPDECAHKARKENQYYAVENQ